MSTRIDLTGQRFERLTVLESVGKCGTSVTWLCRCDCGRITTVSSNALRRGRTHSCGCLHADWLKENKPSRTHGGKGTRLYWVWMGMRERCNNPNHNRYRIYGGRGIRVRVEWNDFAVFREWAYANGYDEYAPRGDCTIDRINPDGDYMPDNCRWVTMKAQNNNRHRRGWLQHGDNKR